MRQLSSLRTKFVRTMLIVTGVIGMASLTIVVVTSVQASAQHLAQVEHYIEEGIKSKGKVLTENHALALRSLAQDNAFGDMQRLVRRAVEEDSDLFYGLYVNNAGQALAYARSGSVRAQTARPPVPDAAEHLGLQGEEEAPPQDESAYAELGIPKQELITSTASIQKTTRLGRSLLEVAVPVIGEEGDFIGVIRYGLSTERMREALVRAKAEATERLTRSVTLVGSLVGVAVLIGLFVSRMQGGRITKPVTDLTAAAQALAAGDRAVRVKIESKDELELLGASFNRMVEELDTSYRSLEEMNRTLEQKVQQRTTELASKNRDMRLVFDNVDQGFATISPEGVMAVERSRVLSRWFGGNDQPIAIWDYLEPISPEFATRFRLGWEQLMDHILPIEACLSQLPGELAYRGRSYAFDYRPFLREEKLEGVLLVITDVTERLAKARDDAEQAELMQVFKRLMFDRSGFDTFQREAKQLLAMICERRLDTDPVLLKRALHTFKGNAASLGMAMLAELCHRLEDELASGGGTSDEGISALAAHWAKISEHIGGLTGRREEKTIEVAATEYQAVLAQLSAEAGVPPSLFHRILAWRLEPVARPFTRLAEQAQALARRLDKGELDVTMETNDVRVDPDRFAPFFSDIVHVVRNAVDHGIESADERVARGKSPRGRIVLRASASAEEVSFEIGDDGRGIDWGTIRAKAKQRGIPHESAGELLAALCHDGITTRRSASLVSGRGIGMAAVRQRVVSLNGTLDVLSTAASGTTWMFRFPLSTAEVSTIQPRNVPLIRMVTGSEGRR